MGRAWEFADGARDDPPPRMRGHGRPFRSQPETHSLALATFGTLLFEWDAVEDHISRPAGVTQLYGYPVSEIEPTSLWVRDLIHPDDLARDRAQYSAQVKARAPIIRGQYRVRHRDGRWINVKTAGAAEYDAQGRLVRLVGCTVDTDEAAILEEAHARLAAVVRHSGDAIFSIDMQGLVTTWNEGAERLYGYKADEIVGRPLATLIPEESQAEARRAFDDIVGGETRVFQATRRRRDGTIVAVEISGAPIRSPSGRILGVSTIHRDVTIARRTALADARLAAVVGASHDAIVTLEPNGAVESWNRGAEKLFGWTAAEALGRPLAFIVPDDRLGEHGGIAARIASGESVVVETVRLAKNGERVAVSASFSPFMEDGAHAGTAVTFRDIGDRLQRESHINLLLKELSHRSKNLLAVVQGIARQSALRTSDFKTFVDNLGARLRALAHSHDLLVQENWHGADMHALIQTQTGAFEIAPDVVRIQGERLLVKPEAAQNIGLSLHELASNALRHGALSSPEGSVDIAWSLVDRENGKALRLTWAERGGPETHLPRRGGFGLLVVSQITPRALGGQASLETTERGGLLWTLEAPADNVLG